MLPRLGQPTLGTPGLVPGDVRTMPLLLPEAIGLQERTRTSANGSPNGETARLQLLVVGKAASLPMHELPLPREVLSDALIHFLEPHVFGEPLPHAPLCSPAQIPGLESAHWFVSSTIPQIALRALLAEAPLGLCSASP